MRSRSSGLARSVALGLVAVSVWGLTGCGARKAPHAEPLFTVEQSDIVVVFERDRRDGNGEGVSRTPGAWFNLVGASFGPVRTITPTAVADSLGACRVLIVPSTHAYDRHLPGACREFVGAGGIVIVDFDRRDDTQGRERWAAVSGQIVESSAGDAPAGRIVPLDGTEDDDEIRSALALVAPLPRMDTTPIGRGTTLVPAIVGPPDAVCSVIDAAAERGLSISGFLDPRTSRVEHLEQARRGEAAIGAWEEGEVPTNAKRARTHHEQTRESMRKLGATEDEASTIALDGGHPAPRVLGNLAAAGIRRVVSSNTEERSRPPVPYQAEDDTGRLLATLVIPCRLVVVSDEDDPATIVTETTGADSVSWITRHDAWVRFWETRSRSTLASTWDGRRLRIECNAQVAGLGLLVPLTVGDLTLAEILQEGATATGETVNSAGSPHIRLSTREGENVLWAIYR